MKAFCSLKADLPMIPLDVKNEATPKGCLFITFLGLIPRILLSKRMKDTKLLEQYTLEGTSSGTGKDQENSAGKWKVYHEERS